MIIRKDAEAKIKEVVEEFVGGIENAILDGEEEYYYWNSYTEALKISEVLDELKRTLPKEVRFIGNDRIYEIAKKYL